MEIKKESPFLSCIELTVQQGNRHCCLQVESRQSCDKCNRGEGGGGVGEVLLNSQTNHNLRSGPILAVLIHSSLTTNAKIGLSFRFAMPAGM